MKKLLLIPTVLLALVFSAYTVATNAWKVNPQGVSIAFEMPSEGAKGTMSGLDAKIDFDAKDPSKSTIVAAVEVKTINTGNEQRDQHLRAADFFHVEKYPMITFTSKEIVPSSEGFIAKGTLTMKDVTKDVEIPFTFEEKDGEGVFKGKFSIFAGDYHVMSRSKTDKDKIDITISVPVKK